MDAVAGVTAFRFVIDRVDHRDTLRCDVVLSGDHSSGAVLEEVRDRIRQGLRFSCEVTQVDALADDGQVIIDNRSWD